MSSKHRYIFAAAASVAALNAGSSWGQSVAYNAPNIITTAGATTVSLGGQSFVNQGMVGTARLPATLKDFNGETLGSFSGMALDLSTWKRNADGSYSGGMYTLPDRGPNNVGGLTTTNYASRLNKFVIGLNPYTGTAALPSNQQQMTMTQDGGLLFRDANGQLFTGRDPQGNTVTRNGIVYPTPPVGDPGVGKISMDAESVAFLNDGSFYVGDEYFGGVFYFDKAGRQIGGIQAPASILPRVNGVINFNGTNDQPLQPGTTGRRSNQGIEGLSVSPDGTRLFMVLQSAALQDNPTNVAVRRNNTRVVVYDIASNRTPADPIGEYVLQLPVFNNSATGTGAANATAAQSEVLALNNSQFLVLSRDGNGRGTNGNSNAVAFKSVMLVDITGATNLTGTQYAGTTPISTTAAGNGSGALVAGITPVQQVQVVNLLNTTQLSRYGINTNTAPSTQYSLSEKWEAMALAPVLEEGAPRDFFLFIGNDNDFVSSDIDAAGISDANTSLTSVTAGTGDNDNVVFVYRLTLPTYVDPQAFASMNAVLPYVASFAGQTAQSVGGAAGIAALTQLDSLRRTHADPSAFASGLRVWGQVDGGQTSFSAPGDSDISTDDQSVSFGLDLGLDGGLRLGAAIARQTLDNGSKRTFGLDAEGWSNSVYVGYDDARIYAQGALSFTTGFEAKITRPAAYGLTATGAADGRIAVLQGEVGLKAGTFGGVSVTPFVNASKAKGRLAAYSEQGASLGNMTVAGRDLDRATATVGVELAGQYGQVTPSLKLGYRVEREHDDRATAVLASVANPGAASTAGKLTDADDGLTAAFAVQGQADGLGWRLGADARRRGGETDLSFSLGAAKRF